MLRCGLSAGLSYTTAGIYRADWVSISLSLGVCYKHSSSLVSLSHDFTGTPMEMIKCPNREPAHEIKPGMGFLVMPLEGNDLLIHAKKESSSLLDSKLNTR